VTSKKRFYALLESEVDINVVGSTIHTNQHPPKPRRDPTQPRVSCRQPTPQNTTKMASSTTRPPASSSTTVQQPAERSFFEQQREVLLKEIGVVRLGFCDGGDALTNE
jgi:hypothetical protein